MLTESEWRLFFNLLGKIVNAERSVAIKQKEVAEKANELGDEAETVLDEFVTWEFNLL